MSGIAEPGYTGPPVQTPQRPGAQSIVLWMTPVAAVILVLAFASFPGFFPPMSPEMTAEQVAAFYRHHTTMIRFSMIVYNLFAMMLIPFFMLIVVQMKRMATPTQVLAYCYLTAAVSGATLFALADLFWLIAAFRPERDPELVMLLNDLAWITFIAPVGMIVVGNIVLAIAVWLDANPAPVFGRWVAPFSILTGAAMVPAAFGAIVKTGPLAWDGLVSFWLRNIAFGVFIGVMFFVVRSAMKRQAAEAAADR